MSRSDARSAPILRLEPSDGGFTVDAGALGPLIGLEPAEVWRLMRAGAITSRFERGEGEDAGRFRVSFFHGRRRVTLVVDAAGTVLSSVTVSVAEPPARVAGGADRS
jgi:hypothetical protein